MKYYKYLLWDVDGTVLDFEAAERNAIRALFEKYNFGECSEEMLRSYSLINKKYWEALERNEMTKPEILVGRFREFFSNEGLDISKAESFNTDYQLALGDTIAFCDDALTILKKEKEKHVLVAITNGTEVAQKKKLALSGLNEVFDFIFISEQVGYEKPSKLFFDRVIESVGIDNLSNALVIGDSLTSDIRGGINSKIDTCWYNPKNTPGNPAILPTYTISDLHELIFD